MAYQNNNYNQQIPAQQQNVKVRPVLKIYQKDAQGKKIDASEIAFWESQGKQSGKSYLSGRGKDGKKYVGFFQKN